jgi:hypothetical protein|tara:strand:- start:501 stop:776 length:276 start_codon:yes stop_codon:yes gene_type:complete
MLRDRLQDIFKTLNVQPTKANFVPSNESSPFDTEPFGENEYFCEKLARLNSNFNKATDLATDKSTKTPTATTRESPTSISSTLYAAQSLVH